MLKKAVSVVTIACMLSSALTFNVFAQNKVPDRSSKRFDTNLSINSKSPRKSGQLIIKYKDKASLKANKSSIIKNQGKIVESENSGLALVEINDDKLSEKVRIFRQNKDVEYVVPNYIRKVTEFPEDDPNDPDYKNQWALQNIKAKDAWITLGDTSSMEEVKVAVIDTGLDIAHEDLKDRVTAGYDFVDMDEDPSPGPVDEEHASHVAGIIAASTDNGIGVAGTAGKAPIKIMPLRVLEAGSGDDFTIAKAIYYAADNGAKVINMSLGGYGESPLLTNACNYAFSKDVVVVAAAGNSADDTKNYIPASIPGVITVSATDINNKTASFSNYGAEVKLAAPGVDVLSTIPGNKYDSYSGTSMATPVISAACAMLISKNPSLSVIEVEQYLTDSAQDLGDAGKDIKFGYGLLDLNNALNIKEIKPRLEITNLANKSSVFDVVDIQTRFTYPEKIVKTDLYIDETVVGSVENTSDVKPEDESVVKTDEESAEGSVDESVAEAVYENKMFTNFELDTNKFIDGMHTLKVVATDKEDQTYTKEIKISIRNTVYTGLRVKLTNEGEPVKGGYVEVYNKHTENGETYYDYIYSGMTSKSGVAIIPGSTAPNGNDYVVVANYGIQNGDQYSYATEVKEAKAPGVIEMDGSDLVPVTIDVGLEEQSSDLFASYKFPGSENSFDFFMFSNTEGGLIETYLNPGTYSFQAISYTVEVLDENVSGNAGIDAIYLLNTDDVEVNSDNSYIAMDSDISNLAKVDASYKNIHGFTTQGGSISLGLKDSHLTCGFGVDDMLNLPDVYLTPGSYVCGLDITGEKDGQLAYVSLQSTELALESGNENSISFGGTLTGKIELDKTKFIPGEELNVNNSIIDSYGNELVFMISDFEELFGLLNNKNILTYKTGANKVKIRTLDSVSNAFRETEEPEEPVEIELKSPVTLTLVDSKDNVIMSENLFYYFSGGIYMQLPQSLATDKYKLKLVADLPYLIQAETSLSVSREVKSDAVKFIIEQPDKTKATSASVEAINTLTGETYYFDGTNLLNGEMFVSLPKANYKFVVTSTTYESNGEISDTVSNDVYGELSVVMNNTIYTKDGKSPAIYNLSSTQLQKVDLSAKDEDGKTIDNPSVYFISMPCGTSTYSALLGIDAQAVGIDMGKIYVSKGTYNLEADIISADLLSTERIIFKPNESIGLKTKNPQPVEFTPDNLTEVSLDSKSEKDAIDVVISDSKTGFSSSLSLTKDRAVKVSKGLYDLDILCANAEYGNSYLYELKSQKDFSGKSTVINCGTDFSMSIKPNKSIYKAGETLKTTNTIADKYGNRVVKIYDNSYFWFYSEKIQSSKGRVMLRKVNGEIKLFDIVTREYIDIPYYDIRAPFINIKDSFDDVIFSAKSPDFYTNSAIKLDPQLIESGIYKIELTVDIDADGNMSAESSFKVK
ncbi:S8 family peptidase [Acetivibrio cellulolyticus]|uniref:S8 family peptidase n=1 Tax=Acetivibrio cellulolyticus TaxID=35830 RepID=UPI0001E2F05C|nr:S8 family peptidase [Acetivibrio cellulolyticus]